MVRVLCVAEKPSISKAVAGHLSGGSFTTHNTNSKFIKNYDFQYDFGQGFGNCNVTMTCVAGHLTAQTFPPEYKNWEFPPPDQLFNAPVVTFIPDDKKIIAKNIESKAKYARLLIIWTDCDLEGEYIGHEIVEQAKKGNPGIQVKRAKFSNIERAHVLQAAQRLTNLDEKQVNAVAARIELDLRIGYAFTRFMTTNLRNLGGPMQEMMLSYGGCQFPTLGFVVDQYFKVKNFVPETFWSITLSHTKEGKSADFSWARNRLFDRMTTIILYERALSAKFAEVTKLQDRPTRNYKPLPLTTVELQKAATALLRMTGQHAMSIAEGLYQKGFISYPRTETDRFDKGMDLKALCKKQYPDQRWGQYARDLVEGGKFRQPREGKHDDKAHPPIHPVTYAAPSALSHDEGRLYEYVVRRFLACCSEDALGKATDVDVKYGDEKFSTKGVVVLERNYLDVFIYTNWNNSKVLPPLTLGERFEPTSVMMTEGKTSPPSYLTEADLIALMDANGIGTDATMAEHIQKIQDRSYAATIEGRAPASNDDDDQDTAAPSTRGGRGGRGGRGSRGGRGGASSRGGGRGGQRQFVPTQLGVALILGYDRMDFETSLSKPFLRKEMELKMKAICEGRTTKDAVIRESVRDYRVVYGQADAKLDILKAACREFVFAS